MSISDFDKGWILGFIEGEGSFTHDIDRKQRKTPRLFVTQTNKEPLELLKTFFNGGRIYHRFYKEKEYWGNKSARWDYIVRDIETLKRVRDFCEGKLKHPFKIKDFEEWKKLFTNNIGKEGQRELARSQMLARWKDPFIRAKIINSQKNRWKPT